MLLAQQTLCCCIIRLFVYFINRIIFDYYPVNSIYSATACS